MKQLNFSIKILASREKVWRILLEDATYRQWTSVFSEGSYAVGDWSLGSKMLFLGSEGSGISSEIAKHIPNEYLSIQHLGVIVNGVEDFNSEETRKWSGALENYTLEEKDGITTLTIDIDVTDDHEAYFLEHWPKALDKVKALSESA